MSDAKKLGMCNFCQSLGPVFEQENKNGVPTFLICHNCITDIVVGIEQSKKRRPRNRNREFQRYTMEENWQQMQEWLDNYKDSPKE